MPPSVAAMLVVALFVVVAFLVGSPRSTGSAPRSTIGVAGRTDVPVGAPTAAPIPGDTFTAEPEPTLGPELPGETDAPTKGSAILPGVADRSSLAISATYRVTAAITVSTGVLDVTTRIDARNDSGGPIDRLELNTIAARLGNIKLSIATVDDAPVQVTAHDQTLVVSLGGILPDGATATVRIAYRATLRKGVRDSDWMFSRDDGTLALYRWIPWISAPEPFDRPNAGDPFVTASSPQVDVELLTDKPMVLAAPAAHVDTFTAGGGGAWAFTVYDVRDVALVLAPNFRVSYGEAAGIPIRAYSRPGDPSGKELVAMAAAAITREAALLRIAYPAAVMTVVATRGGVNLESTGQVWVPRSLDHRNREYAVYHGVGQQWFYGLVGNDQRNDPFADEAPADLLTRTVLDTFRASSCGRAALDRSIAGYSRSCYPEVVRVQGGAVLEEIRREIGSNRFWGAMAAYLEANRYGLGSTHMLLETLRDATEVNLLPLLRQRFPSLY